MSHKPSRSLAVITGTALAVVAALVVIPALGHPPDAPYDNTVFAPIKRGGVAIDLQLVTSGLVAPLKGVVAPGEPSRLYVVDQPGQLWAVDLASGRKTLFLDVASRLVTLGVLGTSTFDERGFLGVAFHPYYAANGKLYTYTSEPVSGPPTFRTTLPTGAAPDHQNVIAEWRARDPRNPAAGVDPASRRELMRVDWPQFNHNAGDLAFGPDGLLYFGMGDGGGGDDRDGENFLHVPTGEQRPMVGHGDGNAQNLEVPLGKIHRIDVDRRNSANGQYGIPAHNPFVRGPAGALKEIYAYGLRNPYRFSFDTSTGALLAGDVGQHDLEEVDEIRAGGNYGWNRKEGALCFDHRSNDPGVATRDCPANLPRGLIDPIAQYDTHHEGHSVMGGFVYHGRAIPELRGRYVFAEWSRLFTFPSGPDNFGRVLYLQEKRPSSRKLATVREVSGFAAAASRLGLVDPAPPAAFERSLSVMGMGQDAGGELYVLGNRTGRPFGTGGVLLRLTHPHRPDCRH